MPWPTSPTPEELADEVSEAQVRLAMVPADLVEPADRRRFDAAVQGVADGIRTGAMLGAVIELDKAQGVVEVLERRAAASR